MKKAKFFCDECGAAVPLNARKCPSCGSVFDAVRCPKCTFTGSAILFNDGCPSCGYLGKTSSVDRDGNIILPDHDVKDDTPLGSVVSLEDEEKKESLNLPGWLYTLIAVVLAGLIVVLLVIFLRL